MRVRPTLLVAVVALGSLVSCGGDDADDEAATEVTETTTSDTTDETGTTRPATSGSSLPGEAAPSTTPGSGPAGPGSGRWTMGGQAYQPDVLSCLVTERPDGTILEVVAQGALASGNDYAQVRLVDSPPDVGDASLVIRVEEAEYREELEPSGATTGEVGDLFWEVDDAGTFFLLGSFPLAETDVDVDIEVPCEML
jgi:hypothetical protein